MIMLRHGQSEFNARFTATRIDPGIPDPELTALGHQQAERAAEALAGEGLRRIIVSPYTRALQTAAPLSRRLGLPVMVHPLVRERCALSCDVGSPRAVLATSWPELDFDHLDEVWWPASHENAEQTQARAAVFRAEMAAVDEWRDTVVVSHWGFILCMTGVSVANGDWLRCDPLADAPAEIVWKV